MELELWRRYNKSTLQNPVHTYSTAGNYTVVFTASNAAGSSTVTGLISIIPQESPIPEEPSVSPVKVSDNRLREASPDTVFQSSPYIDVGGMSNVRYRDIIWFDLMSTLVLQKLVMPHLSILVLS